MNIALLIPSLAIGGAERAASILGNHFQNNGHKVYFFLFANSGHCFFDIAGEIVKTHIPHPVSYPGIFDNIRELIIASSTLKTLKQKYHIDVSISFMEGWGILNVCSKRIGERTIVSVRTFLSKREEYSGFVYSRELLHLLYNRADGVVAVSDAVKHDLIEYYNIRGDHIKVIPNVSGLRKYDISLEGKWNYGGKVVVCVGRLDPVKQFDKVIKSFSHVARKDQEAMLVIVGEGKQKGYLEKLVAELHLTDNVILVGAQRNVGFYLEHARCFAMASKIEGFPNAMVEAMAYSIPIVSTDSLGGCGEIIGKNRRVDCICYFEYGIMTPDIDEEKGTDLQEREELLGEAVLEVLENEELYSLYARKSKERSKQYSYDVIMSAWDELLNY